MADDPVSPVPDDGPAVSAGSAPEATGAAPETAGTAPETAGTAGPASVPELAGADGPGGSTPPDADGAEIDAVEAVLADVEQALARLDDGSYGRCQACGTVIADDRLGELPTAVTCTSCAVPAPA
jgi:hypothetical protein